MIRDEPTRRAMKEHLSTVQKRPKKTSRPSRNKERLLGLIQVEGNAGTNLHTAASTDVRPGADPNKTLGQAHHRVAYRSRKLSGFAAMQLKRKLNISCTRGHPEA